MENIPQNLQDLLGALGVDADLVEEVLAEPQQDGEPWIVKLSGPEGLPYATVGDDYEEHASYEAALNHSAKVAMDFKVLVATYKGKEYPYTMRGDIAEAVVLSVPDVKAENGQSLLDDLAWFDQLRDQIKPLVLMDARIKSVKDQRTGTTYNVAPLGDEGRPVTTLRDPFNFVARKGDLVFITLPSKLLKHRKAWGPRLHAGLKAALDAGQVQDGVEVPVMLDSRVKPMRLVAA